MRRSSGLKEVELHGVNENGVVIASGQDGEQRHTRTNSSLAVAFEELRGRMNTKKMADDSRRITRKSKGLNPDAPRPKVEGTYPQPLRASAAQGRT